MTRKALMATVNYWNSPFQVGSHHLAKGLVRAGWEVAFVSNPISPAHLLNGLGTDLRARFDLHKSGGRRFLNGRLWTYVPGAVLTPLNKPLLRSPFVHRHWHRLTWASAARVAREHGFGKVDLLYIDSPVQSFWLDAIPHERSVFRLADNNAGFVRTAPALHGLERDLARTVDGVIYTAQSLRPVVEALGARRTLHVPNGVDYDHFVNGPHDVPIEYAALPRPIALYVGAMDAWFDFDLVAEVARRLPKISFVLIGPSELARARLPALSNLHLLGRRLFVRLPAYMHNADVGLIPFDVRRHPALVNSVNPLKLYEYMACGLPVVSVKWRELETLLSPARLCDGAEEFIQAVEQAARAPKDPGPLERYAEAQDWATRVHALLAWLGLDGVPAVAHER